MREKIEPWEAVAISLVASTPFKKRKPLCLRLDVETWPSPAAKSMVAELLEPPKGNNECAKFQ